MKKKAVLAVLKLISLLFTMFETQFIIMPVLADSGTIYVDAGNIGDPSEDGSLDHPFDKIQEGIDAASSGDTVFVYNGTYSEHVVVNKPLTLVGEDANTTIIEGVSGEAVIECYNASNVKISGFTIRQRFHGINLIYCNNITISGNTITDNSQYGIFLENSRNITISDNKILNNGIRGVYLRSSSNNTLSNNTVSNHSQYGIYMYTSSNNVVSDNTVSNTNIHGIWIRSGSDNNIFSDNMISKNARGLYILDSTCNTLRNNNMTDNGYNFYIDGSSLSYYIQDMDPSNIVDGKPVYYWVNQHNKQVPPDAGYVALVNSTNIIVKDLNLAKNSQGVLVAYTTNSTIMNVNASYNHKGIHIFESGNNSVSGNNITNNNYGVMLYYASNNSISGNTITNNYMGTRLLDSLNNSISGNTITNNSNGIWLEISSNNSIYHNNFVQNTAQVYSYNSTNVWDDGYPSGGNYWSDYTGEDANSDGIGDTPYLIPEENQDNYPLMTPVVVADQIVIDERCDVGSLQTIAFHVIWAHNRSNVVGGSVYVNSTQYLTNSTGWVSFNATQDTVGKGVWTITSSSSFYVIWDRIQIVEGGSSRAQTTITETETIWFKAIYEYDGSVFDGTKGTLYVNGSAMIWSAVKERWEYDCTFKTPGTRVFKISGVSDDQYGLTAINDLAGPQSITWNENPIPIWTQWWFWIIIGTVIAMAVTAIYFLRKRKSTLEE